jgi:hypothetical protein
MACREQAECDTLYLTFEQVQRALRVSSIYYVVLRQSHLAQGLPDVGAAVFKQVRVLKDSLLDSYSEAMLQENRCNR